MMSCWAAANPARSALPLPGCGLADDADIGHAGLGHQAGDVRGSPVDEDHLVDAVGDVLEDRREVPGLVLRGHHQAHRRATRCLTARRPLSCRASDGCRATVRLTSTAPTRWRRSDRCRARGSTLRWSRGWPWVPPSCAFRHSGGAVPSGSCRAGRVVIAASPRQARVPVPVPRTTSLTDEADCTPSRHRRCCMWLTTARREMPSRAAIAPRSSPSPISSST